MEWFCEQSELTSDAVFSCDGVDNLHGHLALQRVPLRLGCQVFSRSVRHLDGDPSDARFPGNLDNTKLKMSKREFLAMLPIHLAWFVGGQPHFELLHLLAGGDLLDLEGEPLVVVCSHGLGEQILGIHSPSAGSKKL